MTVRTEKLSLPDFKHSTHDSVCRQKFWTLAEILLVGRYDNVSVKITMSAGIAHFYCM